MRDEIKKEWDFVISQKTYIYGAAKTAKELYSFILEEGYEGIKGFLVTERDNNPNQLLGLPVEDIHNFNDRDAHILVPHLGRYKEQISVLLSSLGFQNVFLIGQLMTRTMIEEKRHTKAVGGDGNRKTEEELKKDLQIKNQIFDIFKDGSPDFGGVMPYQSMELIGLEGMRPTEYRIQEYGLKTILSRKDDVLDIGCNSGFLDMSISNLVHSVTGVEYDKNLVKAAELVKDYLKISNCTFVNGDFNDWHKRQTMTYHVIFSFAIHHWLDIVPSEYVNILDKLLRSRGYICFESHIYGTDVEFDQCYEEFQKLGYRTIYDKRINDSGLQEREYLLLQKINAK